MEEREAVCLLCFETAEIYEQFGNAHHSTMQSLSGEHRVAHVSLLSHVYKTRHSKATFILSLSDGKSLSWIYPS